MKKSFLIFSLIFFLSNSSFLKAQRTETAVPFLTFNPSPQQNGLASTGVSIPNDDPFGFYYNPAMLGYSSQHNNITTQFYPSKIEWLNQEIYEYNSYAFNIGYNFVKELNGINLGVGLGLIHTNFDSNNNLIFGQHEYYSAFGFGASIDYRVIISIGLTIKSVSSTYSRIFWENDYTGKTTTFDYGILLKNLY